MITTAPSVEAYERMTQRARIAAARLVHKQMRDVERRRRELTGPGARKADEYGPEETVEMARFLLVKYQRQYREPADVKAARLQVATDEINRLWRSGPTGGRTVAA